MQIGIVTKKIGLSVDAIRFYERNALLPRPPRTQGGFRQYAESDVETLAFIRRVQGLGFKLSEIRALLRLRGNRLQPCAPVRRRLEEKLSDVQRKLTDLHKLEHELRLALRSCNRELRKRPAHCPILREGNPQKQGKRLDSAVLTADRIDQAAWSECAAAWAATFQGSSSSMRLMG